MSMRQQTALMQAITLTDDILELLDAGEFDAVDAIDAKRQPLIHQAFAESIAEIDQIKAQHLKSLNDQVVLKLTGFRQSILNQQASLRSNSRAARAYQNTRAMAE